MQCGRPGFDPWARKIPWRKEWHGGVDQYSCLESSMDRGAWQATVHGVAKSRTRLSHSHFHILTGASLMAQWANICLQCRRHRRHGLDLWVRKIPWRRKRQPAPVFLPEKVPSGLQSKELQGVKSDTTEQLGPPAPHTV